MQFKISRNEFLEGLAKVQGIVEKKHTMPILANVLIETKNDKIIITATDLEVGIKSSYNATILEEGKITISAKKLYEIIKELPDKEIIFNTKNNFWVEIKCSKSIFNIVGLSPDEFPKFPVVETSSIINKTNLSEMIDKTLFSISHDETKFNLTGIYIKLNQEDNINYLVFVSTDGHRLSMIKRKSDNILEEKYKEGFILPKKGIVEIKKLLEIMNDDISIGICDNNFSINNNDTTLIMRMVDGEFPDYKRVIPDKGNNSAIIDKNSFLHALKRISILSSEKSKGVKIKIKRDFLTLTSSNPELGDAKEEMQIVYEGDEISIGFNAKYIIDILQVINTNNIILNLKDNISPGRINPEGDENHISVIMPMRL